METFYYILFIVIAIVITWINFWAANEFRYWIDCKWLKILLLIPPLGIILYSIDEILKALDEYFK